MAWLSVVAARAARYLGRKAQLAANDIEMLRFGLECCILTLVSYGVILGIAWWRGITPYVLAALVTASLLRFVSGGAHSATFSRCLTVSVVFMVSIGQLAAAAGPVPQMLLFVLAGGIVGGGFYAVHKWAPADTPAKPIVSVRKRTRFRRLSYIFLTVWGLVMSGLIREEERLLAALTLASMGGCCWQIFSITPLGYRFVAAVDRLFE